MSSAFQARADETVWFQGFNTTDLGIAAPQTLRVYLFSRAKTFGHGKAYAITLCVLVVLDILVMLHGVSL